MSRERLLVELELEKTQLVKAGEDIEAGLTRLSNQENVLAGLRANGWDDRQATRLAALLRETLAEWERHRNLIVERIAYLQHKLDETSH